jgi:hypothetical protein
LPLSSFSKKPFLESALTIFANALIWVGVWGELFFEKRAREAGDGFVAEANARASKANEKAEKERLDRIKIEQEILKQLRPRDLSRQQFDDLVSALEGKINKPLSVHTLADHEASSFGFAIRDALIKAGVKKEWRPTAEENRFPVPGLVTNSTGLTLYVSNAHEDHEAREFVQTVSNACVKAGVPMGVSMPINSLPGVPSPSLFISKRWPPFTWFPEYLAPVELARPPWEPK